MSDCIFLLSKENNASSIEFFGSLIRLNAHRACKVYNLPNEPETAETKRYYKTGQASMLTSADISPTHVHTAVLHALLMLGHVRFKPDKEHI